MSCLERLPWLTSPQRCLRVLSQSVWFGSDGTGRGSSKWERQDIRAVDRETHEQKPRRRQGTAKEAAQRAAGSPNPRGNGALSGRSGGAAGLLANVADAADVHA